MFAGVTMTIKPSYPPVASAPRSIHHTLTVNPARLSAQEKQRFSDNLYQLHCQIFDGVSRESFQSYVVDSSADYSRIRIYMNESSDWVGYCAMHRFEKRIAQRNRVIIRAEAGILRAYRECNQTLCFAFVEGIKYRLLHPFTPLYYLGSFVHPCVLYMFSHYFGQCYPLPKQDISPRRKAMMSELADAFGLEEVEGQSWLVRRVGWVTRQSEADSHFWQDNPDIVVQFYIHTNPGYGQGNGLLTLVPLSFSNVFFSLVRFLKHKLLGHIAS